MRAFFDEVASVAGAAGFAPEPRTVDATLATLTAAGSLLTSSMYRDLMAGERVESDHILGDLRTRARRASLPTPLVDAAFIQLDVYQRRRDAVRA